MVLFGLLWWGTLAQAGAAVMTYIYPPPESDADRRMDYYWVLMRAALEATERQWGPFVLEPCGMVMNADRSQILLSNAETITTLVRVTSRERERIMRPVRIPLDKGLTGYRLFLIRQQAQPALDKVRSLDDLRRFTIGQGSNWVDTKVLRAAGFMVETAPAYESLFHMLDAGRFDLFSRGINEISRELNDRRSVFTNLAIESHLLLYYPLPRYYFFAPTAQGERLAQRVEEGLNLLMRNGQFERMYREFKRQILAGLDLSGRRLFRLENPELPPQTPLNRSELWDNLAVERQSSLPR